MGVRKLREYFTWASERPQTIRFFSKDEDLYHMLLLTGVQAVTANRAGRLVDLVADMYEQ